MKEVQNKFLVSTNEFAKLSGVGHRRVEEWLMAPDFPAFRDSNKKGSFVLIPIDAVREWLNNRARMRLNMPIAVTSFKETVRRRGM